MSRLVFVRGTSSKFWEGSVSGSTLSVQFGRLGTTGQTRIKQLASPAAAAKELARVTAEKLAKGYAARAATPARKPTARRKALVELARRLGGAAVAKEVALACDDPSVYATKFHQRLDDRGLDSSDRQLAWFAVIDGLLERRKLVSLDWKQECDDSVAWIGRLAGAAGKRALAPVAKDPELAERRTYEALELAGGALATAKLALVQLDTSSDSYELIVMRATEVAAIAKLAKQGGAKISHLAGKEFAALEQARVRDSARAEAKRSSPNAWTRLVQANWDKTTNGALWTLRLWPFPVEDIREASAGAPAKDRPLIAMALALHDQSATKLARATKDPKLCLQALVYLGEKDPKKTAERLGAAAILAERLRIKPGTGPLPRLVVGACNVFAKDKIADRAVLSLPAADRTRLARIADGLLQGAACGVDWWNDAYRALRTVGDARSLEVIEASRSRIPAKYADHHNEMIDVEVKRIRKRVRA